MPQTDEDFATLMENLLPIYLYDLSRLEDFKRLMTDPDAKPRVRPLRTKPE